MKKFLCQNWYRLSISGSFLLFAFGFVIWSLKNNSAKAGEPSRQYHIKGVDIARQYSDDSLNAGFYESNGSLYNVWYWKEGKKWQASWVLDFSKK